ncbi:MmgE/PrpD family protein [Hyphomicrobiales bacterium]|nr:MmgE/PrpD family protein [Hyphomicrobiales bacterium]CAH1691545.1 MmgE/PrpD family protein [Hyphomicrobiales bacterium]
MSSLTQELARLAAALEARDLPEAAIGWASRTFADTIACGLAGAGEDVVSRLAAVLPSGPGQARVWGAARRDHMLNAAQLNGVAAHALDFDDCHLVMDGHPSVSIVPALIALAEELDASGEDLLAAYVAGIEAELRLAALCNPAHADRGWHPTVTFGVIGSAIACGRLLRLDASRMTVAIAIAASQASGLRANSGTMTKPLHAGQANRNGLQAALLAAEGFTANPTALEHRFGFMAAFNGGPEADPASVLASWGEEFLLLTPGIAIKQYPCCAFIHSAIDAAGTLRQNIPGVEDIASVTVHLHRRRLRNIDRPEPRDGLDAKFSTQYLTARALAQPGVGFDDFEDTQIRDAAIARLAARVHLVPHDAEDLSYGRVEVTLADGRTLSAEDSVAMGRGPANPMTDIQFAAKFHDCAGRLLSHAGSARLLEALLDLSAQRSARALGALMERAPSTTTPEPRRPILQKV